MGSPRDAVTSAAPWSFVVVRTALGRLCSLACAVCVALPASPGCAANPEARTSSAATGPARAAVVSFLDAIKRGDDAAARSMLTKLARTKTAELGIAVTPPVNDSCRYTVGDCEIVNERGDLAHVATVWSEADAAPSDPGDNIIWVVRLDPEGWRVAGMAMKVFDDLPPLLLDFEDPEDMLAKQQRVAQELQKREQQTAQAPATDGTRTAKGGPQPQQPRPVR